VPKDLPGESQWFKHRKTDGSDEGLDNAFGIFFVENRSYSRRVER